jgi:NAD(P) transhydrogenase subunit alpha
MKVAVLRETRSGEQRVAVVPMGVKALVKAGLEVTVEGGAGTAAGVTDDEYRQAGATVGADARDALEGAGMVLRINPPSLADPDEISAIPEGAILISFLNPLGDPALVKRLRDRKVTALSMELVPRITRAQSMDALSSQATVAGYKAVLVAADRVQKLFPMLMTAAGTIAPVRALVIGAGVAGLQAIATARRLGAVVAAFDVRPAVKEQVESLGASFLELGVRAEETAGGYATELTPEQQAQQQAALEERIPDFDIVITTAAIPGRPAPKLIPASAVERMRPGSVVVDVAAETGGNCELTRPGEVVEHHGVTVVGTTNLPSLMAFDASQLYSRNVAAVLRHLAPNGKLALDWEDEITVGSCVTRPDGAST